MIRKKIKKIPVIGELAVTTYKKLKGLPKFTTSDKYWEERYKKGYNSGTGSYNKLAEFKAEIINSFVEKNDISTVIEFGCGDGNQLKYFNFKSYIGYDVSKTVISLCRNLYKNDASKQFDLIENHSSETAELTLSLDVIYHLVEDETYFNYMKKVFGSSTKYTIVYSSDSDDHENNNIEPHVKHRNFTKWVKNNAPQFKLIQHIPNKYSYNGNGECSSYADFFIFQKQD